jgi:hypothetical protein
VTLRENGWVVEVPFDLPVGGGHVESGEVPKWLSGVEPLRFVPVRRGDPSTLM